MFRMIKSLKMPCYILETISLLQKTPLFLWTSLHIRSYYSTSYCLAPTQTRSHTCHLYCLVSLTAATVQRMETWPSRNLELSTQKNWLAGASAAPLPPIDHRFLRKEYMQQGGSSYGIVDKTINEFAATWQIEITTLREVNQTKTILYDITYMWHLQKWYKSTGLQNRK